MPGWDEDQRHFEQRLNVVEREVAAHKAQCEERHKEIQRRFEAADVGRSNLHAEMSKGFGELRGMFTSAHNENARAITDVRLGQSQQWVRIAGSVALAVLGVALGYLVSGKLH